MKRTGIINISIEAFRRGVDSALRNHAGDADAKAFMEDYDRNCQRLYAALLDGSWKGLLGYKPLEIVNNNGKKRHIECPNLATRIYQWVSLETLQPLYAAKDNGVGLNCKRGCGITARDRRKSVLARVKRLYYDMRRYGYVVTLDQRKCYDHVRRKHYRKALKLLTADRRMIDFAVDCAFTGDRLPIGTPTSPFVHHLMMLPFDLWLRTVTPFAVRYADNVLMAFETKEEAQAAKWRVRQYWWYAYGIRAKRHEIAVTPIDVPVDFCGYVFHRNPKKGICEHGKGHVTVRRSIAERAERATDRSWGSYFGLLRHADCWTLMRKIEKRMRLRQLTERIRINRALDARNIDIRDLAGERFDIVDYEIRRDNKGTPNWMKCLVGLPERDGEGKPTGRVLAREFHGNFSYLIAFLLECEREYGKEALLPLEEMEIENSCGYIFKGSTNQMEYLDDAYGDAGDQGKELCLTL